VAIYAVFWITLKPLYRRGLVGPLRLACIFTFGSIFDFLAPYFGNAASTFL